MTTTKYNRKKSFKKTTRQLEAERQHQEFLKKMGVDDESLKRKLPHDKKGRRLGINELPDLSTGLRLTSDCIARNGISRDKKVYTGTYVIGAATMHKSNCVPVTSKEQAIDISHMRR
jgi:hypothetical protein